MPLRLAKELEEMSETATMSEVREQAEQLVAAILGLQTTLDDFVRGEHVGSA